MVLVDDDDDYYDDVLTLLIIAHFPDILPVATKTICKRKRISMGENKQVQHTRYQVLMVRKGVRYHTSP